MMFSHFFYSNDYVLYVCLLLTEGTNPIKLDSTNEILNSVSL